MVHPCRWFPGGASRDVAELAKASCEQRPGRAYAHLMHSLQLVDLGFAVSGSFLLVAYRTSQKYALAVDHEGDWWTEKTKV